MGKSVKEILQAEHGTNIDEYKKEVRCFLPIFKFVVS